MDVFDNIGQNYNYYPTTAIELCVISYEDIGDITTTVSQYTNLRVVWGPARLVSREGVPYSLMYVANNATTGEYFAVIRGTKFDSLTSWLTEDFDVGSVQPFGTLPPGNLPRVPPDALISQGTFNGMKDLIELVDPTTGQSVVSFLNGQKANGALKYLYVTGHSLGGTLTSPLYAYLNAELYGGNTVTNMALWSFAGLTPGGTGYNTYLNSLIPHDQDFLWRIQNSLDIAPFFWYSISNIENIYIFGDHDLKWSDLEKDPIEALFALADSAPIKYSQPQAGKLIQGDFDKRFWDEHSWALQAMHQHHPSTYKILVNSAYPVG